MTNYGDVACLWWDGPQPSWTHENAREMYGYVRKLQPKTLHGNRIEPVFARTTPTKYCQWFGEIFDAPDAVGDYQSREREIGRFCTEVAWDSATQIAPAPGGVFGWGWMPPANPRKSSDLLDWLIQCIGRDGNLLLGVGPRPDGTIDPRHAKVMLEMGEWIEPRAEAIYGTRGGPWLPTEQYVSTHKGNKAYLFVTDWNDESIAVDALSEGLVSARLLSGENVAVEAKGGTWTIRLPKALHTPVATVVELTLKKAVDVDKIDVDPKSLALGSIVNVSGEWAGREVELSKKHVIDGNSQTIWAAPEGSRNAWVEIDLGKEKKISKAILNEGPYARTSKFTLLARTGMPWEAFEKQWTILSTGTTIGSNKVIRFDAIKAQVFRLQIQEATDVPVLADFQLY